MNLAALNQKAELPPPLATEPFDVAEWVGRVQHHGFTLIVGECGGQSPRFVGVMYPSERTRATPSWRNLAVEIDSVEREEAVARFLLEHGSDYWVSRKL